MIKILKIYFILIFISLNFTFLEKEEGQNLEYKILKNDIIKVKDIIIYIKSINEIKSLKFFFIFVLMYPLIGILVLSSFLTLLWSLYYHISIILFKKNKKYFPICVKEECFRIHSDIKIWKILKMLLYQIPQIKGYYNAYTVNNKKKEKKIKDMIFFSLNNYKNIIVFSISPLRLHFILELTLFVYRNLKRNFFIYEFRKYMYYQIYIYNANMFGKVKKMKILKNSENKILFNPEKKSLLQKGFIGSKNGLYTANSINGPHYICCPWYYNTHKSNISQFTGKIPKAWENDHQSIKLNAINYKKDQMYLVSNMLMNNEDFKKTYSAKIHINAGITDIQLYNYMNLLIVNKRYYNKNSLIEITSTKCNILQLEGKNVFEKIIEESKNRNEIKKAEKILEAYEKLSKYQKNYLFEEYSSDKVYDFHKKTMDERLYEIARKREIIEIIELDNIQL